MRSLAFWIKGNFEFNPTEGQDYAQFDMSLKFVSRVFEWFYNGVWMDLQGLDPFPDPTGHLGPPGGLFGLLGSHIRYDQIKKLIEQKLTRESNDQRFNLLQTPSAILGPPGGHFGFLRLS